MQERVVSSSNGYYVFECPVSAVGEARYEVRMGMNCIKRFSHLGEAELFIRTAYEEAEENYQD
jgi:hypothetical protein